MKTIQSILIILMSICFYSCGRYSIKQTLQTANTLTDTCPDSAIIILRKLKDSIAFESEKTQMYYWLLTIKAEDRAYIMHTSDSLIKRVLNYYKNERDKKHLAEVYYYAGSVYRDLGDALQALEYFQQAIEASQSDTNYKLISKIYSQTGTLFLYQDVYDEAMKAYRQAYRYSTMAKDSISIIFNLRDLGETFTAFNNADSALYYYKKAYKQAEEIENQHLMNMIGNSLADLYEQLKKYHLARTILQASSNGIEKNNLRSFYSISADLYYHSGDLDSAFYYCNLLLEINDVYAQQAAHWKLAKIAQARTDCQLAMKHLRQYNNWTDSIQKITSAESIRKMRSLYNYHLHEKENNRLQKENLRQKNWNLSMFVMILIICVFIFIYIQNNKHKKTLLKSRMKELERLREEQYQKSTQFIEENKIRIKELETKLQKGTESSSAMQNLLQAQKEQILRMNSKIEVDQQEQELATIAFRQSDIYNKFHQACDLKDIEDNDWKELQKAIDTTYKSFTSRLYALYPITQIELRICLLIKTNITASNIAFLTGRSKSAITSARKKLYEKIHGEKGNPDMWDNFIFSF